MQQQLRKGERQSGSNFADVLQYLSKFYISFFINVGENVVLSGPDTLSSCCCTVAITQREGEESELSKSPNLLVEESRRRRDEFYGHFCDTDAAARGVGSRAGGHRKGKMQAGVRDSTNSGRKYVQKNASLEPQGCGEKSANLPLKKWRIPELLGYLRVLKSAPPLS